MRALVLRAFHTLKRTSFWLWFFGGMLLLGTWVVLYWVESLFTESHLMGYYCCVTELDLPAIGTWRRTLSDFFRGSPGKHLLSVIFVAVNAGIFVSRMLKGHPKAWLPWLFVFFNAIYLAVSGWLIDIAWSISQWAVGPVMSPYQGYERTWYGIVLHLLLWCMFFYALARVSLWAIQRRSDDTAAYAR